MSRYPSTILLIVINVLVFIFTYVQAGTFDEPLFTLTLLKYGASFDPLMLDKEWYRMFTHMFLHGHIFHIAFNMYALYSVGKDIEPVIGTKKFLAVYFVTGLAAAINSAYWNMFAIGVGASGAIFGLFGFSLVIYVIASRRQGLSIYPILANFGVFLLINILMAKALHADNAAHMGGLIAGIVIALYPVVAKKSFSSVNIEYVLAVVVILFYFSLPRFEVTYYQFFQNVLAMEDSAASVFEKPGLTDEEFLREFRKIDAGWEKTLATLRSHSELPNDLIADTTKLAQYLEQRKLENNYRIKMIERESYIFMDSIDLIRAAMQPLKLDYPLVMKLRKEDAPSETDSLQQPAYAKAYYDSDWVEIPSPPGTYYRIGIRDSLGRWNGTVRDYYANGDVQMKGKYTSNKRDGIFIYYSDHHTYESAGRYRMDNRVGKWETFHENGKLESEIIYSDRYYMRNIWDSLGNLMVKDGFGKVLIRYPNGVVAMEGEYRDGYKQGYWYGRHTNGQMFFEENYNRGRLINGRAKSLNGNTARYDETTFYPLPKGGLQNFQAYADKKAAAIPSSVRGEVKLSFRVTPGNVITDIIIEQGLSPELDEKAKRILLEGPPWISARLYGLEPVDGTGYVTIRF